MNKIEIEKLAKQLRKNILFAAYNAGAKSAHIGGALSIVEIVACLYGGIMSLNPNKPIDPDRDRFILSKGHGCLALYAILSDKGYFSKNKLKSFCKSSSILGGHPDKNIPGVETTTGSLGHGLSIGIGIALSLKIKRVV